MRFALRAVTMASAPLFQRRCNAPTLEVYVTEGFGGSPLVPAFVAVKKNAAGTATVTLAPLAPSATLNTFYVWA